MEVLFQSDLMGSDPLEVLDDLEQRRREEGNPPLNPYVRQLVIGVHIHQDNIDEILSTYSIGWSLSRMPGVDRTALRIAVYEILYCEDVPDPVAVAEAVELVSGRSTDESPGFVNGLLAKIVEVKPTLVT